MPSVEKIVVVAGGAKPGIGEAITRRLCRDGLHVIATFDDEFASEAQALQDTLENLNMIPVNHADRKSLQAFIDALPDKPVAGLVNAMMYFNMEDPDNFDDDAWDMSLAINLTAPNFLIHKLAPRFSTHASVVTVTSTEAFIGSFGASAYAATKAAVHNLTKTHANNLGPKGVRVNVVAPGWIGGVMDTDEVFNKSRDITPLKRLGSPEEVANVVSFLLSQESSFINGSVITVDGGYTGVDTISKYEFQEFKKNKDSS